MVEIKKEGVLFSKTHLEFENEGVFNPAVIRQGENVHLFYRAVRMGNHSSIGYCRLNGPLTIAERWDKPFMVPELEFETQGIEDARIVKIDGLFYMTYTGYDGISARGALSTSKDLNHFTKQAIIAPPFTYVDFLTLVESSGEANKEFRHNYNLYYQATDPEQKMMVWDKNVIFFPRRINGNLVFLYRIRPSLQIVSVKSLKELTKKFWKNYFLNIQEHVVFEPIYPHESSYIGGGCPPIETEYGWLLIYHGVEDTDKGPVYSACAALLDLNDPSKEIARLPHTLFSPEYDWEKNGAVNNVVFPTGTALFGDTLYIYYGAADECIACASLSLSALLEELKTNIRKNEE
jgi:beta-1,2-mannobiose phosphorylase / 1,2-beta-oligomannan phosphorylase